ncbi:S8 family serine peptidase [SAR92 clade bacterium H921]|nr:S8 family serine peptidase [SAR92 clade bacterium H921]
MPNLNVLLLALVATLLSACGGGSSAPNTPPTYSGSSSFNVLEGQQSVTRLVFTDPEGRPVTQTLSGGTDQSALSLTSSGVLSFNSITNFESPTDSNGDNSYQILVTASDSVNEVSRTITIQVVNALEGRVSYGPMSGSSVFIDTNDNFALDADESRVSTDADGFFVIEDSPVQCAQDQVCTTDLVVLGGVNSATDIELEGLVLSGQSLQNQNFNLGPLTTLFTRTSDEALLLQALDLDLGAGELSSINPREAAQQGSEIGAQLMRKDQQIVTLLQSLQSLTAGNPELSTGVVVRTLVSEVVDYAEANFADQGLTIDLADQEQIHQILTATLIELGLQNSEQVEQPNAVAPSITEAVSESVALINIIFDDDLLDLTTDAATEILKVAQTDLQLAINDLSTGVTQRSEFAQASSTETLFGDITLPEGFPDLDEDGIADIVDNDDDGDGVNDLYDGFPRDSTETLDTDSDGIGNVADLDDDNDLVPDDRDPYPLDDTLTPPTAALTADLLSGTAPLTVVFDASESIAGYLNDSITLYAWNFDDGVMANGSLVEHVFASAGSYEVELTVTNSDNLTDTAQISISASALNDRYSVSGSVAISASLSVDSDVNDLISLPVPNNRLADAQLVSNPATVSGYANAPGFGAPGNSGDAGDIEDIYEISALGGEVINLNMSDPNQTDLDLEVFDSNGNFVDGSYGITRFESIKLPSVPGTYYVSVYVYYEGASTYLLTIGQDTSLASSGWSTADDFAIGDIIVKEKPNARRTVNSYMATQKRPLKLRQSGSSKAVLYQYGRSISGFSTTTKTFSQAAVSNKRLKAQTLLAIKEIARQPSVAYAEPNYRYTRQITEPNDERYALQWHYPKIKLHEAWDVSTGSSEIKVAVIDTGVFEAHPDLAGRLSDDGYDFINDITNAGDGDGIDSDGNDPGDGRDNELCGNDSFSSSSFHGTHVAGTIGATTDNGLGVAGVTWATEIMNLRVLGCDGGYSFDIANAIRYAAGLENQSGIIVSDPADIANMSLGSPSRSNTMANAIAEARSAGMIIIAAAGNSSSSSPSYPAGYDGVVSVSATNSTDGLADYSNYGSNVDIAAPGGEYGDLDGDGYEDLVFSTLARYEDGVIAPTIAGYQGTSMAAPHMAGVVALIKSIYTDLNPEDLDSIIISGNISIDLGNLGRDDDYGYGRIDALKAVNFANLLANGTPVPVTPILSFSNSYLNYGRLIENNEVNVFNSGNGELEITSTTPSDPFVSVAGPQSDNGLGTYTISIDRSGLATGVYSGNVTFNSNAGDAVVSVVFEVRDPSSSDTGNAGVIYIILVDTTSGETSSANIVPAAVNGFYNFSFTDTPGIYNVVAGSDLNNNGFICDPGEACGVYPLPDSPMNLVLDRNLSNIDFGLTFRIPSDANRAVSIPGKTE